MTAAAMRGSPRSLGQQIKENQVGRRGKWQRSCLGTLTMVCSVNAFAARRKQQFAEDNDYIIHGTNRETSVFPASSEQGAQWGFLKKWRNVFYLLRLFRGPRNKKRKSRQFGSLILHPLTRNTAGGRPSFDVFISRRQETPRWRRECGNRTRWQRDRPPFSP